MILSQVDINTFEKELDDELNHLIHQSQPNFDSFCGWEGYLNDDNGTDTKANISNPNFPVESLETVPGYTEFLDSAKKVKECISETFQSVIQLGDVLPISSDAKLSFREEEKTRIGFDLQSELIFCGDRMNISKEKISPSDQTNDHFIRTYEESLPRHYDELHLDLETCHHSLEGIKAFMTNFHEEAVKEAATKKSRFKMKHLAMIEKRLNVEAEEEKLLMKKDNKAKQIQGQIRKMLGRNRMKKQAQNLHKGLCRVFLRILFRQFKNKCKAVTNVSLINQESIHFDYPAKMCLYHLQINLKKKERFFQHKKQVINMWTEERSFCTNYYVSFSNYIRPTSTLKTSFNLYSKITAALPKSITYHIPGDYLDKCRYNESYLRGEKSKHVKSNLIVINPAPDTPFVPHFYF